MRYEFRPLTWTGPVTPHGQRKTGQFKASYPGRAMADHPIDWPDDDETCAYGFHGHNCADPECGCDCHQVWG